MNRTLHYLPVLLLLLIAGVNQTWAEDTHGESSASYTTMGNNHKYTKITNDSQLKAGNKYLVVFEGDNEDGAMALSDAVKNSGGAQAVSIQNHTIETSVNSVGYPYEVTLGEMEGAWTLMVDGRYLGYHGSGSSLSYDSEIQNGSTWKIEFDDDGNAIIDNIYRDEYCLNYRGGNVAFFSCYKKNSPQKAIALYMLADESSDVENVALSDNGFFTYVTKNPIDWKKTLQSNKGDVNIHGYKVVGFNNTTTVLVEFGKEEANAYDASNAMTSQNITPAGTPIVLQGAGANTNLVIASTDQVKNVVGNKLKASPAGGTTVPSDGPKYYVLTLAGTTADGNMSNYIWQSCQAATTIKEGKAYLSSEDMDDNITATTNEAKGIFASFADVLNSNSGSATGISVINADTNAHKGDNTFYNMQGMKIERPVHGAYIYKGRKIIIK